MSDKDSAVPMWAWAFGAILVLGLIVSGYQIFQGQGRLETVQSALKSAGEARDQAQAQATRFEEQAAGLQSQLEQVTADRTELQAKLDQSAAEYEKTNDALEKVQSEFKTTQSTLEDARSKLKTISQELVEAQAEAKRYREQAESLTQRLQQGQ